MKSSAVLITDADNTLWDTNQVFADAQLNLLANIESIAGRETTEADRLAFIRGYDQAIARKDHTGLKYPPIMLVRELWAALTGAPRSALDEDEGKRIVERYFADLRKQSNLRTGVRQGVDNMVATGIGIWVVSEGDRDIVEKTLTVHGLDRAVSRIVVAQKTVDLYRRLAKLVPDIAHSVCVGDQLDRDIEPAKRAGLRTAYFPGGFKPNWTNEAMLQFADVVIHDYRDLIKLFDDRVAA